MSGSSAGGGVGVVHRRVGEGVVGFGLFGFGGFFSGFFGRFFGFFFSGFGFFGGLLGGFLRGYGGVDGGRGAGGLGCGGGLGGQLLFRFFGLGFDRRGVGVVHRSIGEGVVGLAFFGLLGFGRVGGGLGGGRGIGVVDGPVAEGIAFFLLLFLAVGDRFFLGRGDGAGGELARLAEVVALKIRPKPVHVREVAQKHAPVGGRFDVALLLGPNLGIIGFVARLGEQRAVGVVQVIPALRLRFEVNRHLVLGVVVLDFDVALRVGVEVFLAHAIKAQRPHRMPGLVFLAPLERDLAEQQRVQELVGEAAQVGSGSTRALGVALNSFIADELAQVVQLAAGAVEVVGRIFGDFGQVVGHCFNGFGGQSDVETQQRLHAVAGAVGVGRAHAGPGQAEGFSGFNERHRPPKPNAVGAVVVREHRALIDVGVVGVDARKAEQTAALVEAQRTIHHKHGHVERVGHGRHVQRGHLIGGVAHVEARDERHAVAALQILQVEGNIFRVD